MRTMRTRLIVGTVLGISVFLAACGAAIYVSMRERMIGEIDRSLTTIARSMSAVLAVEYLRTRGPSFMSRGSDDVESALPDAGDFLFQGWLEDGNSFAKSKRLDDSDLPRVALDLGELSFATITLPDGTPGRVVGLRYRREPGWPLPVRSRRAFSWPWASRSAPPVLELSAALGLRGIEETLGFLRWLLVLTWVASSAGSAAILSWVVHRNLRPLKRLREQLGTLEARKLDQRVVLESPPQELVPVVDQLNEMLARLREAFDRERAFTSHAAHELRTPIAGLRATLEVALSQPREAEEHREAAAKCLEIAIRMQAMVETLLDMARIAVRELAIERIEVAAILEECWESCAEEGARRGVPFELECEPGLAVETDPRLLHRILANLLENGACYADPGSSVRCQVQREGGCVTLSVSNAASAAPEDLAERAFDAFWRADASRSATGRHAGLGLALCARIGELLGVQLEASYRDGRFHVTLEGLRPPT